jgi:hypothetical protein
VSHGRGDCVLTLGMNFCNTISFTFWTVGANGFAGFTGFCVSRFLCVSVVWNEIIVSGGMRPQ